MQLETPSRENIVFFITSIQQKLTMANASIVNPIPSI